MDSARILAVAGSVAKWLDELAEGFRPVAKVLGGLFGILFLISIAVSVYVSLDESGWISHDHDTPVWMQGDWMVGEYRDCGMLTATPPAGVTLTPEARAALPRLFCGKNWNGVGIVEFQLAMPNFDAATDAIWKGGDWSQISSKFHLLPVLYHGRIDRSDAVFVSWRCQRESGSLECKALN